MKDLSTEPHTSTPDTSSPRQPDSSRPLWKRLLPILLVPPVVLLLYVVTQSLFRTSSDPEVVVGGRTRAIQLDVLNGAGQPKLAQRLTDYLRARGFDVVELGNFSSVVEATLVLDRAGNLEAAKQVAAALGLPEERVQQKIDKSLYLDVSVIIGKDFSRLKAFQEAR
jgi:hypothetical protein